MALATLAEALAQYNANLDWEGSPAKAALALQAVRWLLVNRATLMQDGGTQLQYDSLASEKRSLEAYVRATSGAGATFVRGKPRLL